MCADERSNADDMVDILELVPDTIRTAINTHLDSMNSLYPIRYVAPSGMLPHCMLSRMASLFLDSLQEGCLQCMQKLLAAAKNVLGKFSSWCHNMQS